MPQCRHITLLFDILQFEPQSVNLHAKFFFFGICIDNPSVSLQILNFFLIPQTDSPGL